MSIKKGSNFSFFTGKQRELSVNTFVPQTSTGIRACYMVKLNTVLKEN